MSVGIGLFIAFIGLQNAGLSVDAATLVSLISFRDHFQTAGICALLAVIGVILTAILYIRKINDSILIGIFGTWLLVLSVSLQASMYRITQTIFH